MVNGNESGRDSERMQHDGREYMIHLALRFGQDLVDRLVQELLARSEVSLREARHDGLASRPGHPDQQPSSNIINGIARTFS